MEKKKPTDKPSQRRASSIQAKPKYKNPDDIDPQRLFEGQDKRVRGGYEEAISSLHSQTSTFKSGIEDLRTRIKGLSGYNKAKQGNSQFAGDAYREFDYQEFAKQNNILIKGGQQQSGHHVQEKPRH